MNTATWTAGDWCAVLMLVSTAIGVLVGGAWWCSAIFSKVSEIEKHASAAAKSNSKDHDRLWTTVDDHEVRIVKVEAKQAGWSGSAGP